MYKRGGGGGLALVTLFNVDADQRYTKLKSKFIKSLNRELALLPHPWIRNVRFCEVSVIPLFRFNEVSSFHFLLLVNFY